MSLENIIKTIEAQARDEAARIIQESEEKAQVVKAKAQQNAEAEARIYLEEAERKARMEAGRIMTQARLDKRMRILSLKKDIIDGIIEDAFKQEGMRENDLKIIVIMKDGQKQESLDSSRLKEELRPELEKIILDTLKI